MKRIIQAMLMSLALLAGMAHAGTTALGFEIGVTTLDQFKSVLPKKTKIEDQGINDFSGGAQLKTNGAPFEIEGLHDVTFVFDDQKKLGAIFMSMDKSGFDTVYSAISKKYKVVAQQRPFVGNQYAKFVTPDTVIEVNAPHLSFEMSVEYIRTDLRNKILALSAAEEAAKKKREAAKF